jgi:predicted HTH domain antitoxin
MPTTFTIEIDASVLRKAEEYAKEKGLSLSSLVENYLMELTRDVDFTKLDTPITDAVRGSSLMADEASDNNMVSEDLSPKYETMRTIQLRIPSDLEVQDFEFTMTVAAHLYDTGKISMGQGADMVGLSKLAFMEILGKYGVAVINHSTEDLERDSQNARDYRI